MNIIKYIIFTLLSLFCGVLFAQNVNIVFRYDDFTLVNDSTSDKVVMLFQKYNIPVVLGVIPCDFNENLLMDKDYLFLDYLNKTTHNGSVEIALHGLNHKRMTPYGEFKGLSEEEQVRRIRKGKNLLDSIFNYNLVTYIPPWNSHDENTVKALKANKIYIVSSSIYDIWSETVYYPMSTSDFKELEVLIKNNQSLGGIIVVMMHSSDFIRNRSFKELEQILINLKKDKTIRFYTFRGLENAGIYVNKVQSEDQLRQNLLSKILKIKGMFLSPRNILIIKILNTIIYLLFLFMIYFFIQLMVLKKHRHHKFEQYFILLIIAILITLSTWYYWLTPLTLAFVFGLIMLLMPFVFRFFKIYNLTIMVNLKKK